MPNIEEFNASALHALAAEISRHLGQSGFYVAPRESKRLALGESMPLRYLHRTWLSHRGLKWIHSFLDDGDIWHHQIYDQDTPRHAAVSCQSKSPSLLSICDGTLACTVARGIKWIDANINLDAKAYLVLVPWGYLVTIWLISSKASWVVVIDKPEHSSLIPLQLYKANTFLQHLKQVVATEKHPSADGAHRLMTARFKRPVQGRRGRPRRLHR